MKTTKIIYGIALALACGLATTLKAQNLYVVNSGNNTVGVYGLDGSTVNASLISSGLYDPETIAFSGTNLFVVNGGGDGNAVGEYTISGATVNAALISAGPAASGVISGTNLFITSFYEGTVGEYTTSGATVNASLISGLDQPQRIAILGTNLFVACEASGTVGEYTTSGATLNASLITGLSNPLDVEIYPPPAAAPTGPQLNIAAFGNQSVLFYPAWATNYVLQSVTSLASTNWQAVTDGVPVIAVTVTNTLPARFFRLQETN